jgi:hypothetical protein
MRTQSRVSLVALALGLGLATAACDDGGKADGKAPGKADTKVAKADPKVEPKADDGGAKADDGAADDGGVAGEDTADDGAMDDGAPEVDAAADYDPRVQKAAGLAKAIAAEPEKASDILADAGIERAAFEAMIFEISADPKLAAEYQAARAADADAG